MPVWANSQQDDVKNGQACVCSGMRTPAASWRRACSKKQIYRPAYCSSL